ncbi:MAG: hypothetical protein KBD23_01315 [Gammaproteobacteria bacterium]|nr:hypothetical protein [Gammaproteobacteria bacterium]MBP9728768.1 hypothetical protein [Gammaproteobacteria bacterium]
MLDSHLTKILGGCFLSMLASAGICADEPLVMPQAQAAQITQAATKAAPSPAELAYQTQMIALSNTIAAKIAQIQAVQKQIDAEIYPTSLPPLQAQKAQLQKELDALNLSQQQLLAQKTAADMTTALQQTKP